jgi:hypothetical protein
VKKLYQSPVRELGVLKGLSDDDLTFHEAVLSAPLKYPKAKTVIPANTQRTIEDRSIKLESRFFEQLKMNTCVSLNQGVLYHTKKTIDGKVQEFLSAQNMQQRLVLNYVYDVNVRKNLGKLVDPKLRKAVDKETTDYINYVQSIEGFLLRETEVLKAIAEDGINTKYRDTVVGKLDAQIRQKLKRMGTEEFTSFVLSLFKTTFEIKDDSSWIALLSFVYANLDSGLGVPTMVQPLYVEHELDFDGREWYYNSNDKCNSFGDSKFSDVATIVMAGSESTVPSILTSDTKVSSETLANDSSYMTYCNEATPDIVKRNKNRYNGLLNFLDKHFTEMPLLFKVTTDNVSEALITNIIISESLADVEKVRLINLLNTSVFFLNLYGIKGSNDIRRILRGAFGGSEPNYDKAKMIVAQKIIDSCRWGSKGSTDTIANVKNVLETNLFYAETFDDTIMCIARQMLTEKTWDIKTNLSTVNTNKIIEDPIGYGITAFVNTYSNENLPKGNPTSVLDWLGNSKHPDATYVSTHCSNANTIDFMNSEKKRILDELCNFTSDFLSIEKGGVKVLPDNIQKKKKVPRGTMIVNMDTMEGHCVKEWMAKGVNPLDFFNGRTKTCLGTTNWRYWDEMSSSEKAEYNLMNKVPITN